jgi:hypothetical protein
LESGKYREFVSFASSKAESYFEDEDLREWPVAGDDLLLTTTVAPLVRLLQVLKLFIFLFFF